METPDPSKTRNALRAKYRVLVDLLSRISNSLRCRAEMVESAAGISSCPYLLENYGYNYQTIENMSEVERQSAYTDAAEVVLSEIEEFKRIAGGLSSELGIQVSDNIDEWRANAAQKLINKES